MLIKQHLKGLPRPGFSHNKNILFILQCRHNIRNLRKHSSDMSSETSHHRNIPFWAKKRVKAKKSWRFFTYSGQSWAPFAKNWKKGKNFETRIEVWTRDVKEYDFWRDCHWHRDKILSLFKLGSKKRKEKHSQNRGWTCLSSLAPPQKMARAALVIFCGG